MKSMIIYKIATVFISGMDSVFISIFAGTAVVGMYSNYALAVTNLTQISHMAFSSLSASIGNLVALESPEKRLRVFKVMQTVSCWISGFFIFCLYFLLDGFVVLWLGREYVFGLFVKTAVLISLYLSITLQPVMAFREATGMYQKTKYVMLLAAGLKIALAVIMGHFLGLPGVILAYVASRLLTYAWYEPKVLFRDFFNSGAVGYLLEHLANCLMICACVLAAHLIISRCAPDFMECSGWADWIAKGAVCAAAINAVYFVRFFRSPEFNILLNKIKKLKKKRDGSDDQRDRTGI